FPGNAIHMNAAAFRAPIRLPVGRPLTYML
ncbi:MAG: hypothetical protein ACI9UN_004416, partial [Granulosicoccus sp.]